MDLSIVIPVYNEGENIKRTIDGIEKSVRTDHEVLLVYDSPQDTTIPKVKALTNQNKSIKLVKNIFGKGALNAIKTGLIKARSAAVIVTMADCSDDPKSIPLMIKKFNEGFDIVCGSRYSMGGQKIGGPIVKSFLSWFAGLSGRILIGVPTYDLTNSFKLYRKSLLDKINIESQGGFELGMEILLKGYFIYKAKVTEVPATWYDRTEGKSRFKLLAWLPRYFNWYIWALKQRFLKLI